MPFSAPFKPRRAITPFLLSTCLALAACGGSGGSAGAQTNPPPITSQPPAPVAPAQVTFDATTIAKSDPGSTLKPNWAQRGMLQIYVRGYQDSNGDGIGDLKGLISRLDYIKALGVGGIWLMPVNASEDRDHGYAVKDYRGIETDYGSLADMDELLAQAHARGLGVIIDYVINHSATAHPAFQNSIDPASPNRDWYLWQNPKPTGWSIYGGDPWRRASLQIGDQAFFGPFSTQMPDFNLRSRTVMNWHLSNMRFWLNRGVDGFRFDAVGHLIENGPAAWDNQTENHAVMAEVRALTDSYANRYIVCEGPGAPLAFAAANSCASAFAFAHNGQLILAAKGDASALARVAQYPVPGLGKSPDRMATFLSNHDAFAGQRLSDQLGGNLAQNRIAAALMLLQPGVPFIYYGEEIGMNGAANLGGDFKLRTPMSWTADPNRAGFTTGAPFRALSANAATQNVAAQSADPSGLLAHYQGLLALRASRPSLTSGSYESPGVTGAVLSFKRVAGADTTWIAINTGQSADATSLNDLPPNSTWQVLWPKGQASVKADEKGRLLSGIAPGGVWVIGN